MLKENEINPDSFEPIRAEERNIEDLSGSSLTYIQDVWRRFRTNNLSILGLAILIFIVFFALFGNLLSPKDYYTQELTFSNLPPQLECYTLENGQSIYVHKEFTLFQIDDHSRIVKRYETLEDNKAMRYKTFQVGDSVVKLDYSNAAKKVKLKKNNQRAEANALSSYTISENGTDITSNSYKTWNRSFFLGTDYLGRDMYSRLISGLQISLLVSVIACLVQLFIGIIYGGIAGFFGSKTDNIMMRIVDIISTVPLTLYVILLMVVLQPGLKTIIIALASVYWVDMARQVRGQVLSIKIRNLYLLQKQLVLKVELLSENILFQMQWVLLL